MRHSKEIIFLLALLLSAMAFVLWYVIDRRVKRHGYLPAKTEPAAPFAPAK